MKSATKLLKDFYKGKILSKNLQNFVGCDVQNFYWFK